MIKNFIILPMLNPPILDQNKEIINNNAMIIVPPIDLGKVDKSVVAYQFYLQIVNGLLILFNVMFTEYLWYFKFKLFNIYFPF